MVNAFVAKGAELFVLTQDTDCNWPGYDKSLLERVDNSIHVYRAPLGNLHKFKNEESSHVSDSEQKRSFTARLKSMIISMGQRIKKIVLLPDTMVDWYPKAIRYERENNLIKSIKPDIIVSCSMPNTVHLVGYKLSKKYRIPLYLDIADPWAYDGDYWKKFFSLRFKIQRFLENRIVQHAIGSSYSAPGCRRLYEEKYNLLSTITETVVTGFERSLMERANRLRHINTTKTVLFTYGGALEESVRDPKPFFRAAKEFESTIELLLRTDEVTKAQRWLAECGGAKNITIDHYIKFDDYFKEMMSSDIILFFGNSNDIQLPGKIFNCVATGKYIMYLKSNDITNDTVERILTPYKRGIIVPNDITSIKSALNEIVNSISEIRNVSMTENGDISQFSEDSQFTKMFDHISYSLSRLNNA